MSDLLTPPNNPLPGVPHVESPLFDHLFKGQEDHPWYQIAVDLHNKGYAVIDFPDDVLDARVERITYRLGAHFKMDEWVAKGGRLVDGGRVQDDWRKDDDIKAIAANQTILDILAFCYGRNAFPFQTLNFPVGTQQHFHTDAMHFSSIPERFMCGVWVAMEDIDETNGPLVYYPGSHKLPFYSNEQMGVFWEGDHPGQTLYHTAWQALMDAHGLKPDYFHARKGQALIWAANLMHGGAQRTARRTRWSQVTHYYFEDCVYYTPMTSDLAFGRGNMRNPPNLLTGSLEEAHYLGHPVDKAFQKMMKANQVASIRGEEMRFGASTPLARPSPQRKDERPGKKPKSFIKRLKRAIREF